MKASQLTKENFTPEIADRLLFSGLEYGGQTADFILVPGSLKAYVYRCPLAVNLYRTGKSGEIILCGGKKRTFPDGENCTECEKMATVLKRMKIPDEDIFLENKSQTTYENFVNAKKITDDYFETVNGIILVTTAYHLRRAKKLAERIFHCEIYPCPADFGSARRENWQKTEKGRKTVLDECLKFGYYIKKGLIDDFEIEKGNDD